MQLCDMPRSFVHVSGTFPVGHPLRSGNARNVPKASLTNSAELQKK